MGRLTQYDGSGKAESYIGEFDEINIYRGGMEGDYISGYQITRLAQYEDLGTVEELKEISEIKNQVIDQESLDKSLKEIRSLDKDILLQRCENQEIELYQLYKMLGYAKQIASAPADIMWGKLLMKYLNKHKGLFKELEVYKRALKIANKDRDEKQNLSKKELTKKIKSQIKQAKKEIENEV